MIDQKKIGEFLKSLRKEKEKTQEEIADLFGVSSRSVSRWENGNTLPDLSILVELADYYDVDIRELIDGERKSEKMDKETKESLLLIADYTDKTKKQAIIRALVFFGLELFCCGVTIGAAILVIKSDGKISPGYCVIPCWISIVFSILLTINARSYAKKVQKKNQQSGQSEQSKQSKK